ncbi:hypothetical protein EFL14_RS05560 [Enterococcus hirae]|uniref:hypothetical protein n=1 Tax=Enterococcus sp. C63 TaxID=3231324 RepID=UPI0019DA833D|nr:hypothetical protein [Enterococcus hirae]EMF0129517.1 hypothetical protein [Enterococcus hirae]EMF0449272.1 hypothetical protein [Enterococcus hirae]EMF0515078.1 hypothetical protein [Enterococcus hirae]EMF0519618.1 hypothetical protein [Enterococcus hirae]
MGRPVFQEGITQQSAAELAAEAEKKKAMDKAIKEIDLQQEKVDGAWQILDHMETYQPFSDEFKVAKSIHVAAENKHAEMVDEFLKEYKVMPSKPKKQEIKQETKPKSEIDDSKRDPEPEEFGPNARKQKEKIDQQIKESETRVKNIIKDLFPNRDVIKELKEIKKETEEDIKEEIEEEVEEEIEEIKEIKEGIKKEIKKERKNQLSKLKTSSLEPVNNNLVDSLSSKVGEKPSFFKRLLNFFTGKKEQPRNPIQQTTLKTKDWEAEFKKRFEAKLEERFQEKLGERFPEELKARFPNNLKERFKTIESTDEIAKQVKKGLEKEIKMFKKELDKVEKEKVKAVKPYAMKVYAEIIRKVTTLKDGIEPLQLEARKLINDNSKKPQKICKKINQAQQKATIYLDQSDSLNMQNGQKLNSKKHSRA